MGHGAYSVFTGVLASAATRTAQIDLGRAWSSHQLVIPARSNTTLYVLASPTDGGTFSRLYNAPSRAGAETVFQIASATTGVIVPIPEGVRFIKIETQDAIANGATFTVLASDVGSRNG